MTSWLLLLGSNQDGEVRLQQALQQLDKIGSVRALTPILLFPAEGAATGHYHNALAVLDAQEARDNLNTQLKAIEKRLGRDHANPDIIAVDIDILAQRNNHHWKLDPHAFAKKVHQLTAVKTLLRHAGVTVAD